MTSMNFLDSVKLTKKKRELSIFATDHRKFVTYINSRKNEKRTHLILKTFLVLEFLQTTSWELGEKTGKRNKNIEVINNFVIGLLFWYIFYIIIVTTGGGTYESFVTEELKPGIKPLKLNQRKKHIINTKPSASKVNVDSRPYKTFVLSWSHQTQLIRVSNLISWLETRTQVFGMLPIKSLNYISSVYLGLISNMQHQKHLKFNELAGIVEYYRMQLFPHFYENTSAYSYNNICFTEFHRPLPSISCIPFWQAAIKSLVNNETFKDIVNAFKYNRVEELSLLLQKINLGPAMAIQFYKEFHRWSGVNQYFTQKLFNDCKQTSCTYTLYFCLPVALSNTLMIYPPLDPDYLKCYARFNEAPHILTSQYFTRTMKVDDLIQDFNAIRFSRPKEFPKEFPDFYTNPFYYSYGAYFVENPIFVITNFLSLFASTHYKPPHPYWHTLRAECVQRNIKYYGLTSTTISNLIYTSTCGLDSDTRDNYFYKDNIFFDCNNKRIVERDIPFFSSQLTEEPDEAEFYDSFGNPCSFSDILDHDELYD